MIHRKTFFYVLFLIGLFFLTPYIQGQEKMTSEAYIERYNTIAMNKMIEFKIPASITLAQGLLESGNGNSSLAREANNHFGIKCHKGWEGKTFHMDDDEKNECFRAYKHPEDSYDDHSLFLTQRSRYAFLFDLDIMDYKAWAQGLRQAGYATNPRYPELLIGIIERYNLHSYDSLAMEKKKPTELIADTKLKQKYQNPVSTSDFKVVGKTKSGRFLHVNNRSKLIFANEGDRIDLLAQELNVYSWQLFKYNELSKSDTLKKGQIIYVEKKGRKSHEYEGHILRKGESLKDVSQLYGIRLSRIEKINKWNEDANPVAGTIVKLK